VFVALGGVAVYLLIELREYVEEVYFSGEMPEFFDLIYLMVLGITVIVIYFLTAAKSYDEIMEIGIEKKERKKREKERKQRESEIEDP